MYQKHPSISINSEKQKLTNKLNSLIQSIPAYTGKQFHKEIIRSLF